MKKRNSIVLSGLLLICAPAVIAQSVGSAPVAGQSALGVTVTQMNAVVAGWSAKKAVLNKDVYNEQNEKIGKIDDIIIAPDSSVSYAIVGAGGFLGIRRHDVAIPVEQFVLQNNQFVLPGATKEALKTLPKFEYAKAK